MVLNVGMPVTQHDRRQTLRRRLRLAIQAARDGAHDRLPSERKLSEDLGASRGLVRSLLAELETEGLLQRRGQSGWILTGQSLSEPNNSVIGFSEMGRMYGYVTSSEVKSSHIRLAREAEIIRMRLAPLSRVWVLVRLRALDGRPVSLEEVVMPTEQAADLPTLDLTDRSLFAELEGRNVLVSRIDVTIEAEVASASSGELLHLQRNDPVLAQRELGYDQFGRELFLCRAIYRADSYSFRTTLTSRGLASGAKR